MAGKSNVLHLDADVELVVHHVRHAQTGGDILFQDSELDFCYYLQVQEGYLNPCYVDRYSISSNPVGHGRPLHINVSLEPVLLAVCCVLLGLNYTFVATRINSYDIEPLFLIDTEVSNTFRFLSFPRSVHLDSVQEGNLHQRLCDFHLVSFGNL